MKLKTLNSITPAITTTIGKCAGIYSQKLSAQRTLYGLLLSDGGITDTCMNRLAKLQDTTTHQSLIGKLNAMAADYKSTIDEWDRQLKQYAIVVDNVDIYTKPRRETAEKSNTMNHMVQAITVEERVKPPTDLNSKPDIPVEDVQPQHVYPSEADEKDLRDLMTQKVIEVWSQIPALKDTKITPPVESHRFTTEMTRKTQHVSSLMVKFF